MLEQKIITGSSASALNNTVNNMIKEGWKPVGSHHVVRTLSQNITRGNVVMRTEYKYEYSQTMTKDTF